MYLVEPVLGAEVSETLDGDGRRLLAAEPVMLTRRPLSMLLLELRPASDLTLSVCFLMFPPLFALLRSGSSAVNGGLGGTREGLSAISAGVRGLWSCTSVALSEPGATASLLCAFEKLG